MLAALRSARNSRERGNPAADHARAFTYALEHDLACTCHAGEGDGADSVRQALHVCGAQRLGHATRLAEDEALMDYVGEERIPLEAAMAPPLSKTRDA